MEKTKNLPAPMREELIAPCGINCAACAGFLRSKNPCKGCLPDYPGKGTHPLTCRIKQCAASQGFVRCAECPKLPCARFRVLESRYLGNYGCSLVQNGEKIRKIGLEAFVETERAKWVCPSCGARLAIQLPDCPTCHSVNPHRNPSPKG